MIGIVTLTAVIATGVFFLVLGCASLVTPSRVSQFLLGFADSPSKHYVELGLRFLVGGAFVLSAPRALFPGAFTLFGGVVLVTTTCLLFIPWRWHHRFAQRTVPEALRFLPLIGVSSIVLGGLVLWAALPGYAA